MKIKILIYFLLINVISQAQENYSKSDFFKVRKDNHYGLFDTSGKEIFEPKYDYITIGDDEFKVCLNGYCSIIDKITGKTIGLKYEDVDGFHENLAMVKINGKYGYIDKTGKLVIEAIYSSATSFSEGLAMVALKDDKYGFIDTKGKIVIPFKYDDQCEYFEDGFACVEKNGKATLIDKTGKELIPYKYDYIYKLHDGFYEVRINNQEGLIDKQGNEIVPVKYNYLYISENGQIYFGNDNQFGSINLVTGEEIFSVEGDPHENLSSEKIIISKREKYGVINNKGEVLIDFKYNSIKSFTENLVLARLKDKFGVLNFDGKEVLGFEYDHILACSEDIFAVGKLEEGKSGKSFLQLDIIDKNMKKITSASYLNVGVFSEGMLMVEYGEGGIENVLSGCIVSPFRKPGKWGFINKKGKEVVSPQYDSVNRFSEGLAAVQDQNKKWGFIDKKGKVIIPIKYDSVENFKNDISIVCLNKKLGVVDKTGKIVIPIEYDSIEDEYLSLEDYDLNQPYKPYYGSSLKFLFYD